MNDWRPISDKAFTELFDAQYAELDQEQKSIFDVVRVPFWKASIRRSEMMGDESVFVVAQKDNWVLYFDDVEYGFNMSAVDVTGKILQRGGDQCTLKEAVAKWFA